MLKNLSGNMKKAVAAVLAVVLAVGLVAGGMLAYRGLTKKPVNVYSAADFAMTDYWGDSSETSGMVTTEGMQKVMVSETQKVTKVYVTEGQSVKAGDKLLAYDTTLTTLDIKRAQIAVSKKELEIENAQKELSKIKAMQVGMTDPADGEKEAVLVLASAGNIVSDIGTGTGAVTGLALLSGSGTKADPYIYLMPSDFALDQSALRLMYNGEGKITIIEEDTEDTEDTEEEDSSQTGEDSGDGGNGGSDSSQAGEDSGDGGNGGSDSSQAGGDDGDGGSDGGQTGGSDDSQTGGSDDSQTGAAAGSLTHTVNTAEMSGTIVYVILQTREGNMPSGEVQKYWGLRLGKSGDEIVMGFYTPEDNGDSDSDDSYDGWDDYGGDYSDGGSGYTAAEIAEMRNKKEQEIRDLKIELELAKIDLQKKQDEFNNGVVVSQVDGKVKTVRDADEAYMNSEAVIEVSGGGGYYIEGTMSELELDTVQVGQTVTVSSWETGIECVGTIQEISDIPSTDGSGWTNGNSNVSYYPFTVFVDEDADLTEFDYVEITYTAAAQESGNSWYLEKEFIRTDNGRSYVYILGDDGKLKEQNVSTGKDLWGWYTEIKGGLSIDDYVAFPYGDACDGAKAVITDSSEFYNN